MSKICVQKFQSGKIPKTMDKQDSLRLGYSYVVRTSDYHRRKPRFNNE